MTWADGPQRRFADDWPLWMDPHNAPRTLEEREFEREVIERAARTGRLEGVRANIAMPVIDGAYVERCRNCERPAVEDDFYCRKHLPAVLKQRASHKTWAGKLAAYKKRAQERAR